jgi:hypothetical protein
MQLDNTLIAIRERPFVDILDLSLRVIRAYAGPLTLAWLLGALPLAILNHWLLREALFDTFHDGPPWQHLWHMSVLMIWEIPLATAGITLYLGQALFEERPSPKLLFRQFMSRLPQLLWLQIAMRGVFAVWDMAGYYGRYSSEGLIWIGAFFVGGWFLRGVQWPYANEVLLLEGNPLRKGAGVTTTRMRIRSMHKQGASDVSARFLMSIIVGAVLLASMAGAVWALQEMLMLPTASKEYFAVQLPIAAWIVIGYFAVVRFLSYLDLRIRNEGWEVELLMRAEGARLTRQLT